MKSHCFVPTLALSALALLATGASAQDATNSQPPADEAQAASQEFVTRTYVVRDLLQGRPTPTPSSLKPPTQLFDPPAIPGMGGSAGTGGGGGLGGGGGFGGGRAGEPETIIINAGDPAGQLVQLVKAAVAPGEWGEDAGQTGGGAAFLFRDRLVVTHRADVHQRVAELLSSLRSEEVIAIEAIWLDVSAADLRSLMGEDGQIDPEKLRNSPAAAAAPRATARAFDGRPVLLTGGPAKSAIVGANPVVAQDAVGVDPRVEGLQTGAYLQLRATLVEDGAIVDVDSVLSALSPEAKDAPATRPLVPEELSMIVQSIQTSTRIPLNRPVVIAGITPEPSAALPEDGAARHVYLVLQVTRVP